MTSTYVDALMESLRDGPKTVNEVAELTGYPRGVLPETYRGKLSFYANKLCREGVLDRSMSGRQVIWKLREAEE